mmetsp:Transcript_17939/g.28256  ORF Transcript_17939/g.28256 Transcript_17939/m.28256 type:complete len:223 (-) Transcript_17939:45-713(-)
MVDLDDEELEEEDEEGEEEDIDAEDQHIPDSSALKKTPAKERKQDASEVGTSTLDSDWKGFCTAFTSIMERSLSTQSTPVLCETQVEKKLKEEKAEKKEKRQLADKERSLRDQGHALPSASSKDVELELRRIATKGVVRLFNTVKEFQTRGQDNDASKREVGKVHIQKRKQKVAQAAQEKFSELWKSRDQGERKAKRRRSGHKGVDGSAANVDGIAALDEFG